MFGEARIKLGLNERGQVSKGAERVIGGDRVLTEWHNTSISAVGVLDWYGLDQTANLTVYRNPYAQRPINPALFDLHTIKQLRFRRADVREWEVIV
jgi:hypothetical protein